MSEEAARAGKATVRVECYRGFARAPEEQQQIVRSLGFMREGQILELAKNRSTLAAVEKVPHLLRIIE